MRILLLAPWFSTLARLWSVEFEDAGHQVLLITKPTHFESQEPLPNEVVLQQRPASAAGIPEFLRVRRIVRDFDPDVILTESTRDYRLLALARGRPMVLTIHDARPHDATHIDPLRARALRNWQRSHAGSIATFSESVASLLTESGASRVRVVPLMSEMPDALRPASVPAQERRDFLLVGRLRPYKNLEVVLAGWRKFQQESPQSTDRLVVMGHGEVAEPMPANVIHIDGSYAFADAAPRLAAAKGSVCLYRNGSQSGAQLWSMQVGTAVIASRVGGLPEYQLPDLPVLDPDDVTGLHHQFRLLSDPEVAARLGERSSHYYQQHFSAQASAAALTDVLVEEARRWRQ